MKKLYITLAIICAVFIIGTAGGMDNEWIPTGQGIGQAFISMAGLFLFTYLAKRKAHVCRREQSR